MSNRRSNNLRSKAALLAAGVCLAGYATIATGTDPSERIAQVQIHPGSGVSSFFLDNGVRVLHRSASDAPGQIIIRIALIGGEIHETALDRGITRAAFEAGWGALQRDEIKIEVKIAPDAAQLILKVAPDRLDEALSLGEQLVAGPSISDERFAAWLVEASEHIDKLTREPVQAAFESLCAEHVSSDQARLRSILRSDLDQLTPEATRAHLADMCARAPIVVSIVGDIDSERAAMASSEYLGRLGDRPRVRSVVQDTPVCASGARSDRPIRIETDAQNAGVVLAIRSPDVTRLGELRAMIVAAQLIANRVRSLDGDDESLHEHLWSFVDPGELYLGTGFILVADQPAPPLAVARADAIERVLDELAEHGATTEEMAEVRRQIDGFLVKMLADSDYWSRRLCELDRHGRNLDEIVTIRRAYRKIDARFVGEVFERQHAGGVVRVIVVPQ